MVKPLAVSDKTIWYTPVSRRCRFFMRPTLEQLLPLARVHDVPLDDLVDAPATGDPRVHLKPVRRHGLTFVPLTRRPGGVQAFKVIYPAAGRASRQTLQTHEGYEWFYVLDGHVRFVLGDQDLTLGPGEGRGVRRPDTPLAVERRRSPRRTAHPRRRPRRTRPPRRREARHPQEPPAVREPAALSRAHRNPTLKMCKRRGWSSPSALSSSHPVTG